MVLPSFWVAEATLELYMSVRLSIIRTPQPLWIMPFGKISASAYLSLSAIMPISHHAIQPPYPAPSQPLRIITIDHHAYQPSFLSAIIPIGHHMCAFWSEFATFKPIGLFLGTPCIVLLHFTNKEHFNHKYLWKVFQKQMIWWFLGTILCLFQL